MNGTPRSSSLSSISRPFSLTDMEANEGSDVLPLFCHQFAWHHPPGACRKPYLFFQSFVYFWYGKMKTYRKAYRILSDMYPQCMLAFGHIRTCFLNKTLKSYRFGPWLVWLSGLSPSLRTKRSLVRFPVRAHAWVAGQVPSGVHVRGNPTLIFSPSLSFSKK